MKYEKLDYTEDEIKELVKWFEGRKLPEELWMDDASHLTNTKDTVEKTITLIENNKHSVTLMGFVYTLEKIRLKLQEMEQEGNPATKNT